MAELPDTDDPFELLGVTPEDSDKDIKRAYVRLIKVYKPDRDPDAFQRIRSAYEELTQGAGRFRRRTPAPPKPPAREPTENTTTGDMVRDATDAEIQADSAPDNLWETVDPSDLNATLARLEDQIARNPHHIKARIDRFLVREILNPDHGRDFDAIREEIRDCPESLEAWFDVLSEDEIELVAIRDDMRWADIRDIDSYARPLWFRARVFGLLRRGKQPQVELEISAPEFIDDAMNDEAMIHTTLRAALALAPTGSPTAPMILDMFGSEMVSQGGMNVADVLELAIDGAKGLRAWRRRHMRLESLQWLLEHRFFVSRDDAYRLAHNTAAELKREVLYSMRALEGVVTHGSAFAHYVVFVLQDLLPAPKEYDELEHHEKQRLRADLKELDRHMPMQNIGYAVMGWLGLTVFVNIVLHSAGLGWWALLVWIPSLALGVWALVRYRKRAYTQKGWFQFAKFIANTGATPEWISKAIKEFNSDFEHIDWFDDDVEEDLSLYLCALVSRLGTEELDV